MGVRLARRPAHPVAGDIVVEWYGSGVTISHRDDQPYLLWQLLTAVASPTEDLVILRSPNAAAHQAAGAVLRDVVRTAATMLSDAPVAPRGRVCLGFDADRPDAPWSAPAPADAGLDLLGVPFPAPPFTVPAAFAEGWHRLDRRVYRRGGPRAAVAGAGVTALAEVRPVGILLRPAGTYTSDAVAVFDPRLWTIRVGTAGLPVSRRVVDMLRRLFAGPPSDSGPVSLRLVGEADGDLLEQLEAIALEANVWLDGVDRASAPAGARREPPAPARRPEPAVAAKLGRWPTAPAPPVSPTPEAATPPATPLTAPPPAPPASLVAPPPAASPAVPPPASPPVAPRVAPPVAPAVPPPPSPAVPPVVSPAVPPPPVVTIVDPDGGTAPEVADPVPGIRPAATGTGTLVAIGADVAGPPPAEAVPDRPEPARAWLLAPLYPAEDRPSTEEEQRRFAAALGDRFTDLLAVVNGALATWPVLRPDASPAAKADLVAVCLYLGASAEGAVGIDELVRAGAAVEPDTYLPCLVSGLRRLPLHRRPVLRQSRLDHPAAPLYPVGAVLAEPGFACASVATDVTVPGADVDFLIWPATARQVGVLAGAREVDEAVFAAGSRFKVLAVDTAEGGGDAGPPHTAVLLRQLRPYDQPSAGDLDDSDRTVLARLTEVLRRRRATPPRPVEDIGARARIAGPPLGYLPDPGAAGPS